MEVEKRLLVHFGLSLLCLLVAMLKDTSLFELSLLRHKSVFPELLPVLTVLPRACRQFTLFKALKPLIHNIRVVSLHMPPRLVKSWHGA